MAANDRRPHLLLSSEFSRARPFATPQAGRSNFKIAERSRRAHGRQLLRQLAGLGEAAQARIDAQHRLAREIPAGVYLQFESEPGFELAHESLAREASGIELLSVAQQGRRHVATVFVPYGKLVHFERLVQRYLDAPLKDGKPPPHRPLVNNIARIRLATVRGLWTDHGDLYPRRDDESVWWEVWLRVGDDRDETLGLFREQGTRIGLEIGDRELRFLERTVVAVRGTRRMLTRSVHLLNCIAELRRLKDSARFFLDLPARDQAPWVDDALARIQWPAEDAPAVCVLDTGVAREHPLVAPLLAAAGVHTLKPAWGTADTVGHGTQMVGLALYGDLVDLLATQGPHAQDHRAESVKILNANGGNAGELYGALTAEAVARAEIGAPDRARVICLAVTAREDRDRGKPSSWSAAIDTLAVGSDEQPARLIVIAAGNAAPTGYVDYPNSNAVDSIHDPGQAWNALTVGAMTHKSVLPDDEYPQWELVAPHGDLSPYSCTSGTWIRGWPTKPDVVMEGGNLARPPGLEPTDLAELDLLTTHHRPHQRLLDSMRATSAATALAARLAARITARYPRLWPESVRALIVHSADWTPAMHARHAPHLKRETARALMQACGYGVPSETRALESAGNALTLVAQDALTPFEAAYGADGTFSHLRAREMRLHELPWPIEELNALGAAQVTLRVTLSYFIEPNPSDRGWTKRYLYESHGLRFDVKRPFEDDATFVERVNARARSEENRTRSYASEDDGWDLGPQLRHLGSVHSDRWRGTATDLASRGKIVVYPTMGWWRERRIHERWNRPARYALVVSIETAATDIDLYAAVEAMIPVLVPIRVDVE